MIPIHIYHRITRVPKPHWMSNPPEMSIDLLFTLIQFKMWRRHIQKIIIEVDHMTTIHYFTVTGRWVERLYESGFMKEGTL